MSYKDVWKELPADWFEGLNTAKQVTSTIYNPGVNRYGVKCGADLQMWEEKGWITAFDPYGWFQWYCRFYQGRRCADDDRQIGRANRCHGKTGRWRINLYNKILRAGANLDDARLVTPYYALIFHFFHPACALKVPIFSLCIQLVSPASVRSFGKRCSTGDTHRTKRIWTFKPGGQALPARLVEFNPFIVAYHASYPR